MGLKKISVVVPVYNVERYLARCVESLLNQTLKDIEIILVDDGSPDTCPAICDEYAQRYSNIKVVHKENNGLGLARNSGMTVATGKYIVFVDSDDFVTEDMCEILFYKAEMYNADIVYANHFKYVNDVISNPVEAIIDDVVMNTSKKIHDFMLDMIATMPNIRKDTPIEVSVWAAAFRRSTIVENNIRFVSERDLISEDIVFNLDLYSKASIIVLCPEPVYYYCFNSESLSKCYNVDRFEKDKKLWRYLTEKLQVHDFQAENVRVRLNRFLIARVRCAMCSIVDSQEKLGLMRCINLIRKLENDAVVEKVMDNYPINEAKSYQKLFLYALRAKRTQLLIFLCRLNNVRKRKRKINFLIFRRS